MSTQPIVVNPTVIPPAIPEAIGSQSASAPPDAAFFPKSAIVGLGKEFVDLYGEHLESPAEFLYTSWHTCFGLAISPYVRLDLHVSSRPRLYTILLGNSALPRKSTAINVALRFWDGLPPGHLPASDGTLARLGRGFFSRLQRMERYGKGEDAQPDERPTLVAYDELRSFVEKSKLKGSLLLPMITSLFEGEEYDGTTAKRKISLRNCKIGLLGASTLDTYEHMWTPDFTDIGLPNRLFILKGTRTKSVALPIAPPEEAQIQLKSRVWELVTKIKAWSAQRGGKLSFSPDAKRLWEDYYPEIEKGGIHSKRLDSYAFRWMILLSLSQDEFEVSGRTVEEAIRLIEYELAVRRLYDPIDYESSVAKMEEKIRRVTDGRPGASWPYRVLQQRTHSYRVDDWVLTTALTNLEKAEEMKREGKNAWIRLL